MTSIKMYDRLIIQKKKDNVVKHTSYSANAKNMCAKLHIENDIEGCNMHG